MSRVDPAERRLRKRLAANVRRARDRASLSVQEAASRAGMHWRHWQKIEAGEVNATLRTLGRLSDVLGVDSSRLLAD